MPGPDLSLTAPPSSAAAGRAGGRRSPERLRETLVVALGVVSGCTDAIGLLALGGAFTSVMTGNMVILGVSAASGDGARAASAGLAIFAFCAGVAVGARVAGTPQTGDPVWPRRVTAGLLAEFVLFLAYAVGWWVTGGRPGEVTALVLLLCTAIGLGIQSSTVQRFGVNGLSTTYLTGTLTTVVIRLATRRPLREVRHSAEILLGLIAGAAAGTGLIRLVPLAAPVFQLGLLAAVIAVGMTLRPGRPERSASSAAGA